MKIAFFELEDWEKEELKTHFPLASFFDGPLSEATAAKARDFDAVSVFIYSRVNAKVLDMLPRLKFIATRSTGFDHIDIEQAKKRKIAVSNVPSYGENTVAEHTFALILSLSRKIVDSADRTRRGDFTLDGLRGFDLKGKTIGIIGTGHIGLHVARIAKGLQMSIVAYDLYRNLDAAKELGFKYVSLGSLLKSSDIVTLHCPYNKSTHHLINAEAFRIMKKGVIVVNTARGGLIDTKALLKALALGTVGAAGLDVLEEEVNVKEEAQLLSKDFAKECDISTMLANHMLQNKRNVIITPHNAFNSKEALMRILLTTIDNIKKAGKINTVA